MKYLHSTLLIIFIFVSCTKSDSSNSNKSVINKIDSNYKDNSSQVNEECVEYVALWSAGEISEQIGKDKKWVFINYTVDIWDKPHIEDENAKIVGKLRASSYAPIIGYSETAYLVESPMGKVHGWLDKSHVKSTLWKNKKTKKICADE